MTPYKKQTINSQTIKLLQKGDNNSYKAIFDSFYESLCRFAYGILKNREDCEDVVCNVMMNLWKNRETLDLNISLKSYLIVAVKNGCLNHIKKKSIFRDNTNNDDIYNRATDTINPLGQIIATEMQQQLVDAIESLPSMCRTVFEKSRYEDLSYEEIATELNISVNTVKYHIKTALAKMHKKIYF